MKFTSLKKSLADGDVNCIYLFEGEDEYFKQAGERMLKDKFLSEPSLNFTSFEGENLKGENLNLFVDACQCFPFMSEKRIVKVSNLFPTEKEYDRYLSPLFENFPQSTIVIIVNTAKPKIKAVSLKTQPNVTYVDCSRAGEDILLRWIYTAFKKAEISVDTSVCDMIMRYCLLDMSKISAETEKLISYASDSKVITEQDVDDLVYKDSEYKIYEMTNAISKTNFNKFISILYELREKGFDDMSLLNSLNSYFKTLFEVSQFRASISNKELAKLFNMKEYALLKTREQCQKFTKQQINDYYFSSSDFLSGVKQGKYTADSCLKVLTAKIFSMNKTDGVE